MLILQLGTTRQVCSKNVVIITDRKFRNQVSDQELGATQNITKHVIGPPSVSVMIEWSWWLKQWHLEALFTVRKSHDYACDGIKLSLSVRVSRLTQSLAYRVPHVLTHFHWLSAMSIKLPRICSLFSLVNISWCWWHFAALHSHTSCILLHEKK